MTQSWGIKVQRWECSEHFLACNITSKFVFEKFIIYLGFVYQKAIMHIKWFYVYDR